MKEGGRRLEGRGREEWCFRSAAKPPREGSAFESGRGASIGRGKEDGRMTKGKGEGHVAWEALWYDTAARGIWFRIKPWGTCRLV